ncbi:MAG: FMN-binding negative transcriptional regulator [Pseudomonadota bacterium]
MFEPPMFREERVEVMHALMTAHPFATLVSCASGVLSADHVPLAIHDDASTHGFLRGHLSAGNPLAHVGEETIDVLAVFQGPQAYISPSWYPSKQEHGKVVPTWNYAVVQAHGTLRFMKDRAWLMDHLADLTRRNESHRPAPWATTDAPATFMERQLKGLVGIEIEITALSGKWKMSQNKAAADQAGVATGLLSEETEEAATVSRLVKDYAK